MRWLTRFRAWIAVAVGLAIIATFVWCQRLNEDWPKFPDGDKANPQVIVKVEPTFGWRLGDVIPVTLFIKQPQGITIDLNSLAVEGDFELVGSPTFAVRTVGYGVRYIRVDVKLRSFRVARKWILNASMSYTKDGDPAPKSIVLPGAELYTSTTWNGRNEPQKGPMLIEQGWHLWINVSMIALAGVGFVLAFRYYRREAQEMAWQSLINTPQAPNQANGPAIPQTRWGLACVAFNQAWLRTRDGVDDQSDYKEIEGIVRQVFRIETHVAWEIPFELGHDHPFLENILLIQYLCNRVLYEGASLSDAEKTLIKQMFYDIVSRQEPETAKLALLAVGRDDAEHQPAP